MLPSLSPAGVSRYGRDGAEVHIDDVLKILIGSDEKPSDLDKVWKMSIQSIPRLSNGERLDGYMQRKKDRNFLIQKDLKFLLHRLPIAIANQRGAKKAYEALLSSSFSTIRKFLRVWTWVDTCLSLSFGEELPQVTHFKVGWWKLIIHEVTSTNSIYTSCKKWSKFALYLTLHFGGAIQPVALWESWMPAFPDNTWLRHDPCKLSLQERVWCRILSDKRGLPCGDEQAQGDALNRHLLCLTQTRKTSAEDLKKLQDYSEIAASAILQTIPDKWFRETHGHVSLSNSSCFENTRLYGGKRTYILSCMRAWLMESPSDSSYPILPTGESVGEVNGKPRWQTVHPPNMSDAKDIPSGLRKSTGLLSTDFVDGEQTRVGYQLFCWAFCTLVDDGYLDKKGVPTGKPMPISRVSIGEPGFKVRVATRSKAAFIVYGQPFAHSMRELLEGHPALRAGLSSGYQLHEWLKQFPQGKSLPKFLMVGDFEAATDYILHDAGITAMEILLKKLNCANNSYAMNYTKLLLSPRILEENGEVTITTSGCLMGEPGTKIVLTFLALVANCYARADNPSVYFATAGDDQIDADDDPAVLLKYAEASRITSMIPSDEKWGVFRHSAVYCQQLVNVKSLTAMESEISIPKPRLISSETKQSRGDDETNPAYGKASQLSKEATWSPFKRTCAAMKLCFIRNMSAHIERTSSVFLPREWGGLGLLGPRPSSLISSLPEGHITLIRNRENGCNQSSQILSRWSSSRNFQRGIVTDESNIVAESISEFMPQASVQEVTSDLPQNTRFRERIRAARLRGWIPKPEFLRLSVQDDETKNIWDMETIVHRGFASLPWRERSKRMLEAGNQIPGKSGTIPDAPGWKPFNLIMSGAGYQHVTDVWGEGEHEEGELLSETVPCLGQQANPRIFLHYDNHRLLLNATSR